ncbi:hypothetical protein DFP72DRAFT_858197 [Ephemerocybe angulata]|uniref:Uncharacterized protein n=1 Tax=Ephemerocybe angulata TaxID=980116 RepID=A0A8H6HBD4_9AGAR|nr:hypothetical protein DFP72DRAFT_858197 [Tulosesus angulatus]
MAAMGACVAAANPVSSLSTPAMINEMHTWDADSDQRLRSSGKSKPIRGVSIIEYTCEGTLKFATCRVCTVNQQLKKKAEQTGQLAYWRQFSAVFEVTAQLVLVVEKQGPRRGPTGD